MNASIIWFRQDLRINDNPALTAAVNADKPVLPIYILDDENAGPWKTGSAGRVWLYHALNDLNKSLNNQLMVLCGNACDILPKIIKETNATSVFWNRCYEPWRIKRDTKIKQWLNENNIHTESFQANLLWEPWDVLKADKTPYKVFTPYYRKGCLSKPAPRKPLNAPDTINYYTHADTLSDDKIEKLNLLPSRPRWDISMVQHWTISEEGAHIQWHDFLNDGLKNYKEDRNIPSKKNVSRMSPYLHWGQISPFQIWHSATTAALTAGLETDLDHFHSEIGWREFSHHLLYHFPSLPEEPLQSRFKIFPWNEIDHKELEKWQKGYTGYPIIDAGMRELWTTGYMHNRVRMIVGSFLVKNMLTHWCHGESWFWDTLFDADLANNAASWQWIAGCGADAAPYFRVFNPVTQSEKFDPHGTYIKQWVPELKDIPNEYIHKPWQTPPLVLRQLKFKIGENYPAPMMDHATARERALSAFQATKNWSHNSNE